MVKKIIKDNNIPKLQPSVACIGYFDGVHLGHQQLIKQTIKLAKKQNVLSCLICFEPDPMDIITGKKNNHITSYQNRLNIIESFGIEQVLIIKFNSNLMKLSPKKFVNTYLNKLNIKQLVCGYDFSFGYKGIGNITDLINYGKFETIVIPEYKVGGKKVSSTRIKESFVSGNFKLTNKLLGWDYCLELVVTNASKKGYKWLIETKLRDKHGILPKDGKYANGFEVKDNKVYLLGPSKLKPGQIILTSFSNE